jgi:hypothetical protein
MATLTLERGPIYTPPQSCSWCGERRARFLAHLRVTPAEEATWRDSGLRAWWCLFQCDGCHATRVLRLRDNRDGGGEPPGEHC